MKYKPPKQNNEIVLSDEVSELVILKKMSEDLQFAHMILGIATPEIFSAKPLARIFTLYKEFYLNNPKGKFNMNILKSSAENKDGVLTPFIDELNKIVLSDFDPSIILFNADKFIREQKLSIAVRYAVDLLKDAEKNGDPNAMLKVSDMVANAVNTSLVMDMGLYYFDNLEERFARMKKKCENVVHTGIEIWDNELISNGKGLPAGTLTVIAGQGNIGKSIVLGNMATNMVKSGKKVALISFEMDQDNYANRIDASLSNTPINDTLYKESEVIKAINGWHAKNSGGNLVIKQFPTSSMTPSQLKGYLIKLRTEFDFDVVIVDYLNLMLSDRGHSDDSVYTKIKQIAEDLRAMAIFFAIPVVSATQLNRAGYNIKPTETNIAECIALHATADIMIALYMLAPDQDAGVIRSIFMKNRYGPKNREFIHAMSYSLMRLMDGTIAVPTASATPENNFAKLFGAPMASMMTTLDDTK